MKWLDYHEATARLRTLTSPVFLLFWSLKLDTTHSVGPLGSPTKHLCYYEAESGLECLGIAVIVN
jgi:hypothetical protein